MKTVISFPTPQNALLPTSRQAFLQAYSAQIVDEGRFKFIVWDFAFANVQLGIPFLGLDQ